MHFPTLADRVWFAYHCLPVDHDGALPSYRSLEIAYGLSFATFSKTVMGTRTQHARGTIPKLAEALRGPTKWLDEGKGKEPTLPKGRIVPPRPGGQGWTRYGDVPDWAAAVDMALSWEHQVIPPEAFLAGADFPIIRPITTITDKLATWVSGHAWETSTPAQQTHYSTQAAKAANGGPYRARPRKPMAAK